MLFQNVLTKIKRKTEKLQSFKQKNNDCKISVWNSKEVYNSNLFPLHNLSPITEHFYHKGGLQFTKVVVAVKNVITLKNIYTVYDLDDWPINPLKNFILRNCLFDATKIVQFSEKGKYMYSGYGIAFDSAWLWTFGNGFARNVISFGDDNSFSSHTVDVKQFCWI